MSNNMLIPKYSDRLNFFLVIHNKEVPMKKEFGTLLNKLQFKIITSTKANRMLLQTLTMAASTERDLNTCHLPEVTAQNQSLENLQTVFHRFFTLAEKILNEKMFTKSQRIHNLLALLVSTVTIVNSLVLALDNAWLPKYGSISAEYLNYGGPIEFLELLPIADEILGKEFKRTTEKLKMEIVPIRAYYDLLRKPSLTNLIHF